MGYIPEKDVCHYEQTIETDYGKYRVGIFSYNNGDKKLGIQQEEYTRENKPYWTSKISRMPIEVAQQLAHLINEVSENAL